jgi:hypothetical protein
MIAETAARSVGGRRRAQRAQLVAKNTVMSTVVLPEVAVSSAQPPAARAVKPWLIGPWFDLLFVANIAWPALTLVALTGPDWVFGPLSAVQVYFLSTPHRWITLALVLLDRDRFWKEPAKFGGLALLFIALGVVLVTIGYVWPVAANTLVPFMMLDYVWNAWHFASQHAGISRIYGRSARPDLSPQAANFEKSAIRLLVLWVFVRYALLLTGRGTNFGVSQLSSWLDWVDPVAVAPVLWLLARELTAFRPQCLGRLAYLVSVAAIYVAQLLAIRAGNNQWMIALFLAGAVFHATEYLAIVSWSVRRKSTGVWRYLMPRYALSLLVFMTVLMVTNALLAAHSLYAWALMTLFVSLFHYGYDGIIWKSRPAPAK